jgi:acyl-CoA synthetase (AMP-forming)/AMP-acid ligase II
MTTEHRTLVELVRRRADQLRDRTAYTFLADGEREDGRLCYAELDERARAIAVALGECGVQRGARALLLYPPGLDFIPAFFGCLYAGVIAVPSYPPQPAQLARALPRLLGILDDAEPSIVLSTSSIERAAAAMRRQAPAMGNTPWLATDTLDASDAGAWREPAIEHDQLAFLQYTSGSTAAPKGVMVSHANLLHNLSYARRVARHDEQSVSVSWLPVIHDMGLIEGVLGPVYNAYPAHLMAPAAFLQRPVRWLRAITKYRATTSGAPNFAYDLCARRITDEQRAELDLRSWRIAYNGAEPIRADTLTSFYSQFRDAGFAWKSFFPVYGLAESTLLVSTGDREYEPVILDADADALQRGTLEVSSGTSARRVVSSGPVSFETRVAIADPDTHEPCADGNIGEIWVASPSVARGYWRRPQESAETFNAFLATGDGPFLRTGDLGVLRDGELFVTGRLKDVLIVRGMKHYPQDLELTAERQHPAIRAGCAAAFAVDADDGESVVIAMELDPRRLPDNDAHRDACLDEVIVRVREAIAEQHGIVLSAVSLLSVGDVPKTSSGKLRRRACRAAFLDGTLRGAALKTGT